MLTNMAVKDPKWPTHSHEVLANFEALWFGCRIALT